MLDYTGIPCPICKKEFTEKSDIVVCPECGAPYHRDCYKNEGNCIFDLLHEKNETWKPPVPVVTNVTSAYDIKDVECLNCGVLNSKNATNCTGCGNPLQNSDTSAFKGFGKKFNKNNIEQPQMDGAKSFGSSNFMFDPMGGVKANDFVEDDISYGEVSKVVQQTNMYYLPVFQRIKRVNKGKFNFSAFAFSGGWLLHRKMYKIGIPITILMFILYVAQTFISVFYSYPILEEIYTAVGADLYSNPTYDQYFAMSEILIANPMQYLAITAPVLILVAMWTIMIILGIKGNKLYLNHCIKTIKNTKANTTDKENYDNTLLEKGGVNTGLTFCLIICYFICSYFPYLL